MTRRRAAIATFGGNLANTVIASLQAVVLIPIYIVHIGPTLYGAWLGSGDFLVWLQVLDLGLPNLMIQRIGAAHGRKDPKAIGEWLGTTTLGMAVISGMLLAIALAAAPVLPGLLHLEGEPARTLSGCFGLAAFAAALLLFNSTFVGYSRAIQDPARVNAALVVSGLVGFACSVGMILGGKGLWAIPVGMLARAVTALLGSAAFVIRSQSRLRQRWVVRRHVLRELVSTTPATAIGGLSYASMNYTDTALVAMLVGPGAASVYGVTKKLSDLMRAVLDTVGMASYGGFAHLVASKDRARALEVHSEIVGVRHGLAFVAAAVCIAANGPLVGLWVDPALYGGDELTTFLSLQLVAASGAYLLNYLYRATGAVQAASWLLFVESAFRVPLAVALVLSVGMIGVPIAAVVTAVVSSAVLSRLTVRALPDARRVVQRWIPWPGRAAVLALGIATSCWARAQSWGQLLGTVAVVGAASTALVVATDHDVWGTVVRTVRARRRLAS